MASPSHSSTRVVLSAVFGNGVITIGKFAGWLMTGSPSMVAEAIHSLADTSNQILLYVGIRESRKEATRDFPMGKGRAGYLWNLISAVGIFFVGFGVTAYHGVHSLITRFNDVPQPTGLIPIVILITAFLIEGYVLLIAWSAVKKQKEGQKFIEFLKRNDDPTSVAVLFEDGIAVLGVIIALSGIWVSQVTNSVIPDAIASILIACLLGVMALFLAYSNYRLLIGLAAHPTDENEIKKFIENFSSVEKVMRLRTSVMGPDRLMLSVELEFHGGILIDRDQISKDAESIRSGQEDPLPVLVSTAERMVRTMGNEINRLERLLYKEFPELSVIDLEVN